MKMATFAYREWWPLRSDSNLYIYGCFLIIPHLEKVILLLLSICVRETYRQTEVKRVEKRKEMNGGRKKK